MYLRRINLRSACNETLFSGDIIHMELHYYFSGKEQYLGAYWLQLNKWLSERQMTKITTMAALRISTIIGIQEFDMESYSATTD